jgi:hypothetical protein
MVRTFIISTAAIATLFSSAALTQQPGQGAASIPDFSGIWGHPYLPGFEPPLSGPGPVLNKSRLPNGIGNLEQLVGDYSNPILQPWAAEVVKRHGEISLHGEGYPTPNNQCWPGGVPFVLTHNIGIELLQQPHQVTILYSNDHEVRHVRLNQSHPAQLKASWYGDSVGHYEGDTLVIDTVGIKVGPFAMLDWYGTPHTEALHVMERYRLIDYEAAKEAEERGARENVYLPASASGLVRNPGYKGKGLQLEITVEDVGSFTMPWSATITYRRPSGEWLEVVCAENPHEYYTGNDSVVPRADNPDF